MTGRKGAVVGGVVGGVIGILGCTVLLPLGIGAAVGGLAAKLRDSGSQTRSSRTSALVYSRATRCSSSLLTRKRSSRRWRF